MPKARAQLQARKQHARDDRGQHSRTSRRRNVLSSGADVLIESGAALVIQNNTAASLYGGGLYQESEGSSFRASGNSTRMTIEGQHSRTSRRRNIPSSGADVLIERSHTCDPEQHSHKTFWRRFVSTKRGLKLQGQWKQHA